MKCEDDILIPAGAESVKRKARFWTEGTEGTEGYMKEEIILGKWTEDKLNRLLEEASAIGDSGSRVDFLSGQFLETPYEGSTLIGDMDTTEVFVVNLAAFDCFTFIDCIEAMRRSRSYSLFKENLKDLRYRSGEVAFKDRNHFFTDWTASNPDLVADVTGFIGAQKCRHAGKRLNEKKEGIFFLPGVALRLREVTYIPSACVDEEVVGRLKTGDYVGIYSEAEGLDVSHVGIVIKKKGAICLRHASSVKTKREVVDEDLKKYLESKPGIIILRPKA